MTAGQQPSWIKISSSDQQSFKMYFQNTTYVSLHSEEVINDFLILKDL